MKPLTVGRYIGAGAYGTVYRARWGRRKVAIKQFHLMQSDADEDNSSIMREIKMLESLRDNRVIQFYGTTYHENKLVLIMEYAQRGSLHDAIKSSQLDWPAKTRIADEIAQGLAYIHGEGIIHRDLKSMNVLLTKCMEVKLCDFGLATIKVNSDAKTCGDTAKGTFRWMAPELLTTKPKYSNKSDMFALGMVMWEMAANCTVPYRTKENPIDVAALVLKGEREVLPDHTPAEYHKWVERCWHHDPMERPEAIDMVHDSEDDDPDATEMPDAYGSSYLHFTKDDTHHIMPITPPSSDVSVLTVNSPRASHADKSSPSLPNCDHLLSNNQALDGFSTLLISAGQDAKAQMAVAEMYERGKGVAQNDSSALKWYLLAAEQKYTPAQSKVGYFFQHGRGVDKSYPEALYWYRQAATKGDADACGYIGELYFHGLGVERSFCEALTWFRKAAVQGNAIGQCNLGFMYQHGYGVEQSFRDALLWFRKSASQGNAAGQCNLGWMYHNGFGVERDYYKAVSFYRMSAEQGYAPGQCNLGFMCQNGLGTKQDYEEALLWFLQSAFQGYADAQNSLGYFYLYGQGVEQNLDEALSWFGKAVAQNNASAQCNLGDMYRAGQGVEQSSAEAVSWYRKSAYQGHPVAQRKLGLMYRDGDGVPMCRKQARRWLRKAVEKGDEEAKMLLKRLEHQKKRMLSQILGQVFF